MSSAPPERAADAVGRLRRTPRQNAGQRPPGAVGGRLRRRPAAVWMGLVVVLLSSIGFAVSVAQAGRKVSVLAVARPVPAGAVVTAADLREVRLGVDDAGGHVVPAVEKPALIGETAVVPLVPGALLAPHELGTHASYPPAGKAQVSFAVEPGGLPAGLSAGQRVAVVPGPAAPGAAEQPTDAGSDGTSSALVGTVTDIAAQDRDSAGAVVTMLVETGAARRAAQIDKPHLVVLSSLSREVP